MTFLEMQTAFYDEFSVANTDSFLTLTYVKRILNRMKKKVEATHDWPHLERAMMRDSEANEYYNYPENWKQDSIYKLKYNGDNYDKVKFADYLRYQEDEGSNSSDKIFSDFRNRFFINPAPTEVVTNGIVFWGQEYSDDMSADGDESPFTLENEIEEIIIELAIATALKKSRGSMYTLGVTRERDALTMLEVANRKIMKRKSSYKYKNREQFKRMDLFPRNTSEIGNFTIRK